MVQVLVSLVAFFHAYSAISSVPIQDVPKHSLLHIIEYIGTDYPSAVAEGKVINQLEYEELSNFAATAPQLLAKLLPQLPASPAPLVAKVQTGLQQLQQAIALCKPAAVIQSVTRAVRDELVTLLQVKVIPVAAPSLEVGRTLYQRSCANCHGADGAAKTELAAAMHPPPLAFTDIDKMALRSPSGIYHALVTGVRGTSMPAFAMLTEHELWSLSFFVFGFQFAPGCETKPSESIAPTLADLASTTDEEWLTSMAGIADTAKQARLQYLRMVAPYAAAEGGGMVEAALVATLEKIAQAIKLFEEKSYEAADHRLLEGYLDGFEKLEGPLSGSVPVPLIRKIEGEFLRTRTYAQAGNSREFFSAAEGLTHYIQHAQSAYQKKAQAQPDGSPWGDFFSSLLIILREGFEAFLVILALLTLLRNVGARDAYRWVHAGWICAVIAGGAAYLVLEGILHISGAARETLEATITCVAVVLLFYTGFWLLNQSEQRKWHGFLKDKTCWCLDRRSLWSLFGISFIAVFREAAETVLFYAALFSTAHHPGMVGGGFLAGVVTLCLLGAGIVHFQIRIPMRQFFLCTSILMLMLSVVLAGKGDFELMQAGYIQPTPVRWGVSLDLFGIYPILQPLLAQGVLVVVIVGVVLLRGTVFSKKVHSSPP